MQKNNRIQILDGFRVLAILMVMVFHYYARYQGTYYSYSFSPPEIFMYGNLGVQLFFIISGFVITLTLTKSKSFIEFMKKRLLRLIPGMIICATITYLVFVAFDKNNLHPPSKNFDNLLFSYTFISPDFMKAVFNSDLQYIDGAYWSLWVELQFYVLGGFIYFLSPNSFLRNYLVLSLICFSVYVFFGATKNVFASGLIGNNAYRLLHNMLDVFPLFKHNLWFLCGIVIFKMYHGKKDLPQLGLLLFIFVVQLTMLSDNYARAVGAGIMILFLLFLYNQKVIGFLSNRVLSRIGVASYSIYLIHEFVGFLIINRITPAFGTLNWIIPIGLIGLFTAFGLLSYKYLEKPLGGVLKKLLFKNRELTRKADPSVATLP